MALGVVIYVFHSHFVLLTVKAMNAGSLQAVTKIGRNTVDVRKGVTKQWYVQEGPAGC